MKLTTLSVPKISDNPAATRNKSMPLISPPVVCVTRQDADDTHASSACRSKIYSEWEMGWENWLTGLVPCLRNNSPFVVSSAGAEFVEASNHGPPRFHSVFVLGQGSGAQIERNRASYF